ncbi:DUF3046 domain-containing protein [Arthrobacter sp. Sa2BUA2]|uniref:DUF3046 domain-containing protein n=1 Tax=Arthrobacter pullicola TaxID=2762224 RepID=A0ABR8YFB6_9MICC|nr:DUF3046 domain-containing protein [Arthrobacter pullicola]MBD8042898.1 DUF3046 domain-containing protein [Arthrobacter pullicola]
MRISDFWRLMDDEFGPAYSRILASDLVLTGLGGQTASQALEKGVDPKRVWLAVCEMQEVPPERRLGRDIQPKRD